MAANTSEAQRISPLGCFSMTWIWGPSGAADKGMDNHRNNDSGDPNLLILERCADGGLKIEVEQTVTVIADLSHGRERASR
jgi:hypothetical protein